MFAPFHAQSTLAWVNDLLNKHVKGFYKCIHSLSICSDTLSETGDLLGLIFCRY